ncbi:MAG: 23S rRNA (guanosine(2251)-2'-O)-methyltransferase RlmB [Ruminococcus sp.]|nr:23S rRNA (guanosine(2251)-2'-O)-methyltransferase RlmB [Ruminococcus sp.]
MNDRKDGRFKDRNSEPKPDVISGRNPVSEAIRSGRPIDKIMVARGEKSGAVVGILAKARDRQIPIKEVDKTKLDFLSGNSTHQGIIAFAAVKDYSTVDEIFEYAESRGESPFIVVLDEVEDPHNLGAIIRTAECAGVHGVIVPKRRSASLSYTVGKVSAGAVEYMRVARVTNIANLVDELKERGVWVYGADMNGTDYAKCDFSGACAIVIGNEGKGISRLVREKCDVIVSLPMKGKINSLNASVAAGILMYSAMKNR